MAQFNPQLPDENPREYLDYSRGIGTNKTWETLFSNAGDVLSSGAKAVDAGIQRDIYTQTEAQVDNIRSLFGVDAAVSTTSNLPSEIKSGQTYISKLKAAYNNGSVSETYYNAKLESVVKSMRAKYPGYNAEIDNTIQAITGVIPANAIVNSIQAEAKADAARRDAEASKWQSYVNQNEEYIGIALPDFWKNPDKYSQSEVHAAVTKIKADETLAKYRSATIAAQMAQGQLDDKNLESSARSTATDYANNVFNGGLGSIGKTYQDLALKFKAAQADPKSLSPDELGQLTAGVSGLRSQVMSGITKILMDPLDPTNPQSGNYWSHLNEDKRKDIISSAMAPLDMMMDGLTNQNYGIVNAGAAWLKSSADFNARTFLQQSSLIPRLQAARQVLGDPAMSQVLTSGDILPEFSMVIKNWGDTNAMLGDMSASDSFKTMSQQTTDPKVFTNHLNSAVGMLTDPKASPTQIDNAGRYLFANDNLGFLSTFKNTDQQMAVFNKLVSPLVTDRLNKAKQSNPQVWNNYRTWAYTNFGGLFKRTADEVQTGIVNRKYLDIKFDPDRMRFTVQDNTPGGFRLPLDEITQGIEGVLNRNALNGIRKLNAGLDSIVPLMQADGQDPAKALSQLLASMGVNPNATKEGPLLDQLWKAVVDTVQSEKPADIANSPVARALKSKQQSDLQTIPGDSPLRQPYDSSTFVDRPGNIWQQLDELNSVWPSQ